MFYGEQNCEFLFPRYTERTASLLIIVLNIVA